MPKSLLDSILMTVENGGEGGGAKPKPPENYQENGTEKNRVEDDNKGFPADTPPSEMTADEQIAYWKNYARKHERRSRSGISPDEHQKLRDELDKVKREQLSDQDKALADAKDAARAEGESSAAERYQRENVLLRLQVATGQPDGVLEYIDHKAFLTDSGEVDADKVNKYATQTGNTEAEKRRKAADAIGAMDAGKRGTHDGGKPSVSTGRERYRERVQKTK